MTGAAIFAWVLRHSKLVGCASTAFALILIIGGVYFAGRHAGAKAEQPKVAAAQAAARAATAQGEINVIAGNAADTASTKAATATAKAQEADHAIHAAQGASDALPADVRAQWRAGLAGVRGEAPGAHDTGGGQPAPAMHAAARR